MNIVEKMLEIVRNYPEIEQFKSTHLELADNTDDSFSLSSTGDRLVAETVTGKQKREHTFTFLAAFSGVNDYERLANSGTLASLALYLESKTGEELSTTATGKNLTGEITSIACENGMLLEVPGENILNALLYQINIRVNYTLE